MKSDRLFQVIDVIIPTKNSESTLDECLQALSGEPVNVFIVDAYSTDDTVKIAEKYGVNIILEPPSSGPGSKRAVACNEGLKYSTSEIVGFIDSDTIVPSGWATGLSCYLTMSKNVGAVSSGCLPNEDTNLSKAFGKLITFGSTHGRNFERLAVIESAPGYNGMYLRAAIDEAGGFNEDIGGCEDWELNKRIRENFYLIMGVPKYPVNHKERGCIEDFSKQMYGYGWSRSRLWKVTGHFTFLHALPSILLCLVALWWPFGSMLVVLSVAVNKILQVTLAKTSNKMPSKLVFLGALGVMGLSWAFGYLKGLIE